MPFATLHYPQENKDEFKKRFPADFIGEAQDQTRSWFYYQHVLSGALFNSHAFKNCIVTGIVLAEDGKKMSKKLKNYPDPMLMMEKYGADAMRFYILSSPVVQSENMFFSEKGLDEVMKKNLGRLQNVLAFYQLYENGTKADAKSKNILDRWILMRLEEFFNASTEGYENYKLDEATRPLNDFIDDLSVWYLRRSRERFKEESEDKMQALATIRYVLQELSKVIAPAMPFFADTLFAAVREDGDEESVHLASWPEIKGHADDNIKEVMDEIRRVVTLVLAQRTVEGKNVKQPLALLKLKNKSLKGIKTELLNLIKDEVNVKEISFDDTIEGEVELDMNITPELRREGEKREAIRFGNALRKEAGYTPGMYIANITSTAMVFSDPEVLKGINAKEFTKITNPDEVLVSDIKKEVKLSGDKSDIVAISPPDKK